MATVRVTKRAIDSIIASGSTAYFWDDELRGFGVRVTAGGVKSYVFQYRLGGREAQKQRVTIGRHGSPWTPESARAEAKRLALLVGQGFDPVDRERQRRREAVDLAFDKYVSKFVEDHLKAEWKDWRAGERLLVRDAIPVLCKKPLTAITRSDITAVLDRMTGRPASARIAHATLRKLFKWAESRGDIARSPTDGMVPPAGVASRDRVLSDPELALIWESAGDLGFPFGPLIRLLMVTGQRREEVAGLDWSEVNREDAVWTLPADRAKNRSTHIVPLSNLAILILNAVAAGAAPQSYAETDAWPKSGLIFTTTGRTPASGHSKAKSRLDNIISERTSADRTSMKERVTLPVPAWRIHDIRRTLATGLQKLGVRFEVTEAVLNHLSGARSGVAGIYQRHDWKDEKRAALDAWAMHIISVTRYKQMN